MLEGAHLDDVEQAGGIHQQKAADAFHMVLPLQTQVQILVMGFTEKDLILVLNNGGNNTKITNLSRR